MVKRLLSLIVLVGLLTAVSVSAYAAGAPGEPFAIKSLYDVKR